MRTRLLLFASTLAVAVSCGAGHAPSDERAIAVYAATIRTVLTAAGTPTPDNGSRFTVYVMSADERAPISLEVQAGVVDALDELATVRFVDERSEAIDEADPDKRVHDDGVLIALGKIPPGRDTVTVEAQRYERAGVSATEEVVLHRTGATWAP